MPPDPIAAQRAYYAETAAHYDEMHGREEHHEALDHAVAMMRRIGATSMLDTGCGTGLAMRYVADRLPDVRVHGNDPSGELIAVGIERYGLPREAFDEVGSERLPYGDGEFDVVFESGVLHHVPDPAAIVSEMLRVASKAVFISDENTFGLGSLPARSMKLALSRAGLLERVNRRRRGGRDWHYTEGDGVAWTYSVFDSVPQLEGACEEVVMIPTGHKRALRERAPKLFASHCLLAGFKRK